MCSTLRPRSRTSVLSPLSDSSLAAHPPEMPEPMTIASKLVFGDWLISLALSPSGHGQPNCRMTRMMRMTRIRQGSCQRQCSIRVMRPIRVIRQFGCPWPLERRDSPSRNVDRDPAPHALAEADHAQRAPRRVPDENRDPDVQRLKRSGLLDHEANPQRDDDL